MLAGGHFNFPNVYILQLEDLDFPIQYETPLVILLNESHFSVWHQQNKYASIQGVIVQIQQKMDVTANFPLGIFIYH